MCNLQNPPWQYSKHQARAEEIEKCLDEDLELTCYFSTIRRAEQIGWHKMKYYAVHCTRVKKTQIGIFYNDMQAHISMHFECGANLLER